MAKEEFKVWFLQETAEVLDASEQSEIFKMLLEHFENIKPLDWLDWNGQSVNVTKWELAIDALKKHRPVQYIIGHAYFNDKPYSVDERVLIPRPETEELVQWIKGEARTPHNILDIGTGSGCIAIELGLHFPDATVIGLDISKGAIDVANQNLKKMEARNVQFQEWDILQKGSSLGVFDIIVSNPPYISQSEDLAPTVIQYEPKEALLVTDNDPLQFYKAIQEFARESLTESGLLFFECHSEHAGSVAQYLRENNWTVVLKRDIYGKERMIMAC